MQPGVKLRVTKCCSVNRLTVIENSSDKQRLRSDCAYAQTGLSLCWSHIPHCWKSHFAAHLLITVYTSYHDLKFKSFVQFSNKH